jgi:hypothetical protein
MLPEYFFKAPFKRIREDSSILILALSLSKQNVLVVSVGTLVSKGDRQVQAVLNEEGHGSGSLFEA